MILYNNKIRGIHGLSWIVSHTFFVLNFKPSLKLGYIVEFMISFLL
jgi:hypothetical protein